MANLPIEGSVFHLLEPHEIKDQRFRNRMADKVAGLPTPARPGDVEEKLLLLMDRKSGLDALPHPDQHVFDVFTKERINHEKRLGPPFALRLADSKPWFHMEQGSGKGVIRAVFNYVAEAVARLCLVIPGPLVDVQQRVSVRESDSPRLLHGSLSWRTC
eukprot:SAG31_NODE_6048_length_2192_cov_2.365504_1_plen_159_part_00